jgi:soluble lytic murein transglycosylase-like protein
LLAGSQTCYRLRLKMARFVLAAAFLLAAPLAVRAGPLHSWIDEDGVYHVSDTPPTKTRKSPRAVAKPPSAEPAKPEPQAARGRRAPRWWEKRSDAPPDEIDRAAKIYNIPAELIRAVIAVESAGDTSAVSHRGAVGLMQLMPDTAGQMYVEDPVDPAQNILGGTRYLRQLANDFGGDMVLVLAAYNAGPDAVRKYKGVPPFEETRQYVKKVLDYYFQLKRVAKQTQVADSAPGPASARGAP